MFAGLERSHRVDSCVCIFPCLLDGPPDDRLSDTLRGCSLAVFFGIRYDDVLDGLSDGLFSRLGDEVDRQRRDFRGEAGSFCGGGGEER